MNERLLYLWAEASLAGGDPATCPDDIPPERFAVKVAEIATRRGWELAFAYDNADRLSVIARPYSPKPRGLDL